MRSGLKFSLPILVFLATSCGREYDNVTPIAGKITLEVEVLHHSWGVENIAVLLADGVTAFPGHDTTRYAWNMMTDSTGTVTFPRLFAGDYYLYAKGYDAIWGDTVIGYAPVSLSSATVIDNRLKTELYVSE